LKGQNRRKLVHGDIVNVANINSPENIQLGQVVKFREFIAAQGVELFHEFRRRLLSIRVKHSCIIADNPMVSQILKFTHTVRRPASNRQSSGIAVGKNFLLNGSLVAVISSSVDDVTVRHADSGVEEILTATNARILIRQYIEF
jgi:hypothetical protein